MRDMHGAVWRAALASVALLVPLAMTGLLIGGTVPSPVIGVALDQQYVDTHDTPAAGASGKAHSGLRQAFVDARNAPVKRMHGDAKQLLAKTMMARRKRKEFAKMTRGGAELSHLLSAAQGSFDRAEGRVLSGVARRLFIRDRYRDRAAAAKQEAADVKRATLRIKRNIEDNGFVAVPQQGGAKGPQLGHGHPDRLHLNEKKRQQGSGNVGHFWSSTVGDKRVRIADVAVMVQSTYMRALKKGKQVQKRPCMACCSQPLTWRLDCPAAFAGKSTSSRHAYKRLDLRKVLHTAQTAEDPFDDERLRVA